MKGFRRIAWNWKLFLGLVVMLTWFALSLYRLQRTIRHYPIPSAYILPIGLLWLIGFFLMLMSQVGFVTGISYGSADEPVEDAKRLESRVGQTQIEKSPRRRLRGR